MSSYERGNRGHHGRERGRGYERSKHDDPRGHIIKRTRDESSGPFGRGKFQKRGGGGPGRGGRGRGRGGKRAEKPEFFDLPVTRPSNLLTKSTKTSEGKIKLCANYFKVLSRNPVVMKMFFVDFNPQIYNPKDRQHLINTIGNDLGTFVYDGNNSIFFLNVPKEDSFFGSLRDGRQIRIRFKFIRDIEYTEACFLQILNIIMNQAQKEMNLELIGRNHFDPNEKMHFPEAKLQIWPGFKTAIRQHEKDLMLCCDIAHKIIREETLLTMLMDIKQQCERSRDFQIQAKKQLTGLTVLSAYNNKTYRVDDVDFALTPRSTFKMKDREVSFTQYFSQTYGIQIRNQDQPLLTCKPKAKDLRGGRVNQIKLIPELCRPVGLTDAMRNDFDQMKALSDRVRMTPAQRVNRLINFNNRLNQDGLKPLRENKLEIDTQLVEFDGRKLPEEKVIFGINPNTNKHEVVDLRTAENTADWTSSLKNIKLFQPMRLARWAFIYPKTEEARSLEFLKKFEDSGKRLGMDISEKVKKCALENDLHAYNQQVQNFVAKDCSFMMIVVPRRNADQIYKEIKTSSLLTGENQVPIQVITLKAAQKQGLSVATKVAIQVNCKLGGIPWIIPMPIKGLLSIGFSITQNVKRCKVIYGAMVASMQPATGDGKFYSCVNKHERGSNVSEHFGINIIKAINRYIHYYKCLPENIIIYRDGCGEGQIQQVVEQEVKDVKNKIKKIYEQHNETPKIAFIIINKRINTRIFAKQGDKAENPPPGTVVDDVITYKERYDFYLISQSVTQGTVAPTSYNIVYDSLGLEPKDIQLISYKLCHLYYNWSGTTRIPSVVQYAQKLAALFGILDFSDTQNLEHMTEEKQLYFL